MMFEIAAAISADHGGPLALIRLHMDSGGDLR